MPLPVIPNTVRVAFNWTPPSGSGIRPATNVMHFTLISKTVADLITNLEANVTSGMWASVRSTCRINQLVCTHLGNPDASVEHVTAAGAKWAGDVTSGDIIPQVAALVSLKTNKRGRSWRGRVYLPYTSETYAAGGALDSSIRTALGTAWTTFMTAMEAADTPFVVASYKLADVTEVTGIVARGFLATQRRRQQRT